MTLILITLVVSSGLSAGAVALVLKLSHKKEWYDHINDRKIHTDNIPRLGGLGFAGAFLVVLAAVGIRYGSIGTDVFRYIPCFAAMVITLFSGAYDDFRPMAPRYKFLLQVIATLCVIIPGFTFDKLFHTGNGFLNTLPYLTYPVTFLWIVGITNAFNLIDGVDGLAGGISALIAFFFGLIFFSYAGWNAKSVIFCACLVGVLIGFLIFNLPLPKAKLFMGDCGSQFLGITLALIPLMKTSSPNSPSALPVIYAAAVFAIPIFDTVAAVWRRLRDRKKIYDPDRSHLHHKLINLGFGSRGVIAILYSLQIVIGTLTFIAVRLEGIASVCFLGAAYFVALAFFSTVHFVNRAATLRKAEVEENPS